jgi:hypothetical protein
MSLREVKDVLIPIIERETAVNKGIILNKLNAMKKIALITCNEDLVACIDRLIACVESKDYCGKYGHEWDNGVVTAPTCEERGYTTYVCAVCKDTNVDNFVQATGHKWGKWVVNASAVCTETRVCENDASHIETRVISGAVHQYVVTMVKQEDGSYIIYHTCSRCGDVVTEDLSNARKNIKPTSVTNGNMQADVNFNIKSANGKGYRTFISIDGGVNFILAGVNYENKGVHIKSLTNGVEYTVIIVYGDKAADYEISDKPWVVNPANPSNGNGKK